MVAHACLEYTDKRSRTHETEKEKEKQSVLNISERVSSAAASLRASCGRRTGGEEERRETLRSGRAIAAV
jgi:hypothetical protein